MESPYTKHKKQLVSQNYIDIPSLTFDSIYLIKPRPDDLNPDNTRLGFLTTFYISYWNWLCIMMYIWWYLTPTWEIYMLRCAKAFSPHLFFNPNPPLSWLQADTKMCLQISCFRRECQTCHKIVSNILQYLSLIVFCWSLCGKFNFI